MPTKLMEELYESIYATELVIIEALKPGVQICSAYEKGLNHFKKEKPDFLQYLTKTSFGYNFFFF